jgi:hypothetical protein
MDAADIAILALVCAADLAVLALLRRRRRRRLERERLTEALRRAVRSEEGAEPGILA